MSDPTRRVLRLTGEQLASIQPPVDAAWFTDWDEYREFADVTDSRTGDRPTHGRHCPCGACRRQDWAEPGLAPCGMHGPSCPPVYDRPSGTER